MAGDLGLLAGESCWRVSANELLGAVLGKTYLLNYCKRAAKRAAREVAQES